jgi:SAM-dependent methyltransferase
MFRVSGGRDPGPFLQSGRETIEDFATALAAFGRRYADFDHLLDFGCGCGRSLRWFADDRPKRISGSDYDAPAVRWVSENLPFVDAKTNGPLPPLEFEDATFDLVTAYSVFTHFDEMYQDAWLAELHRVSRPGAILFLTVQGEFNWRYCVDTVLKGKLELDALNEEFQRNGFIYWTGDGWSDHFPDFYHSAWHLRPYIWRRWTRWFDLLDIRQGGARPTQDIVVLKKPRDRQPGA